MKGILLSLVSFLFLFSISLILLRFYRGKKYFKVLLLAYVLAILFYSLLWKSTGGDHGRIDFWNGFILLALIFHSFWDFCYTTAFTGFSTNLLVLLSKEKSLSLKEILKIYGEEGEQGILSWRLPNLIRGNYLTEREGRLFLRPKGKILALLTLFLKRALALQY